MFLAKYTILSLKAPCPRLGLRYLAGPYGLGFTEPKIHGLATRIPKQPRPSCVNHLIIDF
jgi:hypothetical protein